MSINNKKDNKIKIRTCRICLDAKNADIVLLEEQNGWLHLFEYCFGFALSLQDEPRLLCKTCAEKVKMYAKFKEKCHKSHSLWKSVISDVVVPEISAFNQTQTLQLISIDLRNLWGAVVSLHTSLKRWTCRKCYIVKHKKCESTSQYVNDPITRIKEDSDDGSLDNDLHIYNEDEIIDVKMEMDEEDMELQKEDSLKILNEKDDLVKTQADSKQKSCKKIDSDDSVKYKVKKDYTCVKCKLTIHDTKRFYLKHWRKCQQEIPKKRKRLILNKDYECGRKYDAQNISNVKHESLSDKCIEKEIIGVQNDPFYLCGLCKHSFNTSQDMCLHLKDHWSNNDLACKLCDFIGVDLAAIAAHRYTHFQLKDKLCYLCHICEKTKHSLLALHFHYRRDHLNKVGGYCSRCNKEYITLRTWKKHEFTAHCKPRYICDICGKGFYYKHYIKEHLMNHMKLNKCICDICGNSFTRRSYLKFHKKTVHSNTRPLKCNHCDRVFKNKFTLAMHQKVVAREKTLKCEICNKGFVTPNVLKLHMVMHSDERPYRCEVCDCSYKYKSHLTAHLLMHTGFPSHKCLMCTKAFATARALKRHSSVHTGVRRHGCSVPSCARTFHSKKLLQAHLELRHKNEKAEER